MALYGNLFYTLLTYIILSQVALVVKNCLPMQETRDAGLIPGSGRYPGEGNGNQLPVLLPGESLGQRCLVG